MAGSVGVRVRPVPDALASDRLGVWSVVFFVAGAVAPLTVVAGVISTGWAVTGVIGLPVAFGAVACLLAVFCVGYVAMAQRVRNAGAFSAYITAGLGRPAGVGASLVALCAYSLLQVGTFGAIGPTAAGLVADWTGTDVPWWVLSVFVWAVVAVLGVLRVDVNGQVLGMAVLAEIALVVVLDVTDLVHPYAGSVSWEALSPGSLTGPGAGTALAIAVTGFVGFECAAVFSEETREHSRTVPTATFLALGTMAVLYAGSAWAMTVTLGTGDLQDLAVEHGPDLPFVAASPHLGTTVMDLGRLLFLTSLIAAALSYHNTVSRYLFALGRERVLPGILGQTTAREGAPRVASLTQSASSLAVIGVVVASGADPLVKLFFWGGTTGGFGVLLLVTVTSFAVVSFFRTNPGPVASRWQTTTAPLIAGAGLLVVVWLIVDNYAQLLGVAEGSAARWVLPGAFPVLALVGAGWAGVLYRLRPATYAVIGQGRTPATATTAAVTAGRTW
jgi:amino acid transporter